MTPAIFAWVWFFSPLLGTPGYWVPYTGPFADVEDCRKVTDLYVRDHSADGGLATCGTLQPPPLPSLDDGRHLWLWVAGIDGRMFWQAIGTHYLDATMCDRDAVFFAEHGARCAGSQPVEGMER